MSVRACCRKRVRSREKVDLQRMKRRAGSLVLNYSVKEFNWKFYELYGNNLSDDSIYHREAGSHRQNVNILQAVNGRLSCIITETNQNSKYLVALEENPSVDGSTAKRMTAEKRRQRPRSAIACLIAGLRILDVNFRRLRSVSYLWGTGMNRVGFDQTAVKHISELRWTEIVVFIAFILSTVKALQSDHIISRVLCEINAVVAFH